MSGVGITGLIENLPGTVTPYPVFEDINGLGGFRTVPDLAARDAIPDNFRKIGMVVTLASDSSSWQLQGGILDANWATYATGGGAQGAQGFQGATGTQGVAGSGAQGATGAQGSQGAAGTQGVAGAGAQGSQGFQGAAGAAGSQGSQGFQGALGAQGAAGAQGFQGGAGAQGFQGAGAQGFQGAGAQGAQGFQGAQSVAGAQGAAGAAGSQGSQGFQGATGTQGSQGSQGALGAQGTAGTQGSQGSQGMGLQGAQGSQGTTGAGAQGSQGAQGLPGSGGAPSTVASVAALAALDASTFSDGTPATVAGFDSYMLVLSPPSGSTADGVDLITAQGTSGGLWARRYAELATNQYFNTIYVDGATGNDGAIDPQDSGTPLATLQEAFNRIQRLGLVTQDITVNYSSTSAQSFDADLTALVASGSQIKITIVGALTVVATQTSSSFTTPDPTGNVRGAINFPTPAYGGGEALTWNTSSLGWVTRLASTNVSNVAHFFALDGTRNDPSTGGGNTVRNVSLPNLIGNVSVRVPAGIQIVVLHCEQNGAQVLQGPAQSLVFSQCKVTGGAAAAGPVMFVNCLVTGVDTASGTPTPAPGDIAFQNCTFDDVIHITGGADVVFLGSTTCYTPARLLGEAVNIICETSGALADWSFWDLSSSPSSINLGDATRLILGYTTVWGSNAGGVNASFVLNPGAFVGVASTNPPTIAGATADWTIGSRAGTFAQLPVVCPQVPSGFYFEDPSMGSAGASTYLTAQSANIGATNVFPSNARRGSYRFSAYVAVSVAGTAGVVTLNAIFTDDSGVQRTVAVATSASIAATGGQGGIIAIETNGTSAIQYSVTGIITAGSLAYSVRVVCTPESSG